MKITPRRLPGLFDVALECIRDQRGGLDRLFDFDAFAGTGLPRDWKQVLVSHTARKGTVRGMHIQLPPHLEGKLVVPLSGRMVWAVVDLRASSPTFGQWDVADLSPAAGLALSVPRGFAHGCMSLEDHTSLLLMADSGHVPALGRGFRWDDPELGIAWPDLGGISPLLSDAHAAQPAFAEFCRTVGPIEVKSS